ncbi:PP2C family protein-serine/threonine phosphatase [Patescibacteria group bacterium]|nr:PP2C family protein-serine/threonine phosphatase [Patescibacteria group bacterium]
MSFLRQKIIFTLALNTVLLGLISFGLAYTSSFFRSDLIIQLSIGLGFFCLSEIFLLLLKINHPLKIVTNEMKALLTGKTYKKIMTSKRNEIGILAHFFNEITKNLENISSDVKEHQRIKKELNTAQKIQRDLLPEKSPSIPFLDIVAKTRPASEIGGDTFNFFPGEKRSLIYIGDSTGHGIPAGIIMIMVDTLITTFINMFPSPVEVMTKLNKYLKPHLQKTMFMTMILLDWDHNSKMKWVGAGHEHVIVARTNESKVTSTRSGGIAIGMLADNSALVKEQEVILNEDDFVILFSDGIVEAKNVMGEIYGLERLELVIKKSITSQITSQELFDKIAIDVGRFMEGHFQEDDMTLIVIKKTSHEVTTKLDTSWTN